MDEMQLKLTMTMDSIGKVQQEQVMVAKSLKTTAPPQLVIPARDEAGIMGIRSGESAIQRAVPPANPPAPNPPQVQFPPLTPVISEIQETSRGQQDQSRRNWIPKMDFPKFDGTDVRIWIDKCHFAMYLIPEGFKVAAATMYMNDSAAHWYQAYKVAHGWHDWEQFREAVVSKFEGNSQ